MGIIVFLDGSFRANNDVSSQVSFIMFIADKDQNASIKYFSGIKSSKIVGSVLGAETFVPGEACYVSIFIQHDLDKIRHKRLKLNLLIING